MQMEATERHFLPPFAGFPASKKEGAALSTGGGKDEKRQPLPENYCATVKRAWTFVAMCLPYMVKCGRRQN